MRYDNRLRPRQKPNARLAAWRTIAALICLAVTIYVFLVYGPILAFIPALWTVAALHE